MIENQQEEQKSIFRMFSRMFTGNREGNRKKVTAMVTNSKTILFGYSDSSLSVYDLRI